MGEKMGRDRFRAIHGGRSRYAHQLRLKEEIVKSPAPANCGLTDGLTSTRTVALYGANGKIGTGHSLERPVLGLVYKYT